MTNSIEIFKNILGNDNNIRQSAEKTLQETKKIPFNEALQFFLQGINNEDKKVSQLAALMFKKTLLDDTEYLKSLGSEASDKLINDVFFPLVSPDKDWKFLERIGENIAKLYSVVDLSRSFAQIVALFNNENAVIRRVSIFLLDSIIDLNLIKEDLIQVSTNDFNALFSKGLKDEDTHVRILTLKATTSLLSSITNKSLVNQFTGLTKDIINSLIYCLQNDLDGSKSKSCLETLNILVETHPKLWKEDLDNFINVICEILKTSSFSYGIRQSTFQIILAISKGTPAYLRKSNIFKTQFIPLLMALLKDVDNINDIEAWTELSDDNDHDREELFYAAREGLEILATDLGVKFLDMVNPFITKMFSSSEWTEVHGAFISIGWLCEIFKKQFKSELTNLLNYISLGLEHSHPRVRYAALNCLGMLATANKPYIQTNYNSNILPALAKLIASDKENLRVRTESVLSLTSFLKGLVNEDDSGEVDDYSDLLKPYSKELLSLLAQTFSFSLKIDNYTLQEATLSCISLIATILGQEFSVFYNDIMPFLKDLLVNLISSQGNKKNLIAECINTIAFICSSVNENPAPFEQDFIFFCDLFEKILVNLKEEDPEVVAIFKGYSHISTSMKEKFYPYLEKIFPILVKYITADIDLKFEDVDIEKVTEDSKAPGLILQTGGVNKKLSLKTFTLQNKVMAFDVLKDICLNMGSAFLPYLERYLALVSQLVNAMYSRKIRKIAVRSFEAAIYACKDENEQKIVFDYIFQKYLDKLTEDIKVGMIRDIKYTLKVLIHTITEVKSTKVIQEGFILSLYSNLKDVVSFMELKKQQVRENITKEDAFDENDHEGFSGDLEVLNEVNRRVMELSGIIFKLFTQQISDLVSSSLAEPFLNIMIKAINETKNDQEMVYSLCFFTDILNYGNDIAFKKYYPIFIQNSLAFKTTSIDVHQNIVFGFGIIAERTNSEEYSSIGKIITDTINASITQKRNEETEGCYENGIAALGKILYFQTEASEEGFNLADKFYNLLPLKTDLDESDSSISLLCKQFLLNNPLVNNSRYYAQIKQIFVKAEKNNEKEEFLTEQTKKLISEVASKLQ